VIPNASACVHVSASLLAQTLAGSGGGFSTESIVVKLVSPDAPDLTVIDLPGIVRTATSGQANTVIDEVKMSADSREGVNRWWRYFNFLFSTHPNLCCYRFDSWIKMARISFFNSGILLILQNDDATGQPADQLLFANGANHYSGRDSLQPGLLLGC